MRKITLLVFGFCLLTGTAYAEGLGAGIYRTVTGDSKGAEAMDKAHDDIKHANPNYGKFEEKTTNDVRKGLGLQPHCEPLYNKYGEQVDCK